MFPIVFLTFAPDDTFFIIGIPPRSYYRMNKHGLLAVLTEKKCRLAVAFIYLSDQLVDSSVIEDRMKTALARIAEKVAANAEAEQTPQVL